jgi:hypothetical protein
MPEQPQSCPLSPVDRRLQDAHQLWHRAEAAYFDPESFRLFTQNTIQTLRTVTWILQKQKHVFSDFDGWYGPWQERLRADPLMKWLHDARTKIEKQGDLEVHSYIRAEILASYLASETPRVDVPANLSATPQQLFKGVPNEVLKNHVFKHGTLRIQRRWVENNLSDHELLDALAIAYGRVSEIVHDAHVNLGLPSDGMIDETTGEKFDVSRLGFRMPCMIAHEARRELMISLKDGKRLSVEHKGLAPSPEALERAKKLSDPNLYAPMRNAYDNLETLSDDWFAMIRRIFERDGYHNPMMFLFRGTQMLKFIPYEIEDRAQKYVIMRALAHEAARHGADAALLVNETWIAPADQVGSFQFPADMPSRLEALTMVLARKEGDLLHYQAMIRRENGKPVLEDTEVTRNPASYAVAPLYEAWGRTIPPEWTSPRGATIKDDGEKTAG